MELSFSVYILIYPHNIGQAGFELTILTCHMIELEVCCTMSVWIHSLMALVHALLLLWVVSVLQIISLVGWIPFVSIAVVYGFGDHIQNPDEFGEVPPPLLCSSISFTILEITVTSLDFTFVHEITVFELFSIVIGSIPTSFTEKAVFPPLCVFRFLSQTWPWIRGFTSNFSIHSIGLFLCHALVTKFCDTF